MDAAEVYRRALEHRLQEAFGRPGEGKPHDIKIPLCEVLWKHFVDAVRTFAQPVDPDGTRFQAEMRLGDVSTRLIAFEFQVEHGLLIATCLAGW